MHRLLIGAVVLGLAIVAVRAEDDAKPQKPAQIWAEVLKQYRAAKSQDEKTKVLDTHSQKLLDYAEKNPKEKDAIEALKMVIQRFPPNMKSNPQAKATAMLKKNFIDNKEAPKSARAEACGMFMSAQESILNNPGSNKAAKDAATKEMATIRKLAKAELDGEFKDVFVGGQIPDLKSKDLNDKDVKTTDLKGKVVMFDVWATWCPPCRAMIPHSREMVEKFKNKPFVLVSISVDAQKKALTDFMEKNEMPWTHWWCGATGGIASELQVGTYPTIFLVDAKGVIRHKWVGSPGGEVLDKAVEKLVKEAEDKTKGKTS